MMVNENPTNTCFKHAKTVKVRGTIKIRKKCSEIVLLQRKISCFKVKFQLSLAKLRLGFEVS